ncbi:Family of unknown function [Porphyromonadaceae bacterium KH3R12]|nr:Family of unknown function [Porphyromonadaceae bacterium KH3R12]
MVAKIVRIFAIIIVSIILLNVILVITFSVPAVQKGVANMALEKFRPIIGTKVDLEGIRIRLFNTVELDGIYVEDLQQDTLFHVGKIAVRIHALDLLRNKVTVHKAGIENFKANIHRASPDDPFNFQFIIDAFAKEDTIKVEKEKKEWRITADEVILKNGNISYDIHSIPETPGTFNVSHIDLVDFNFKGKADFLSLENMKAEVSLLNFLERNAGLTLNNLRARMKGEGTLLSSEGLTVGLNGSRIQVKDAAYDLESKAFSLVAESNLIDPRDINIFVPRFAHLDKPISFEVNAEGTLPQAELNSLVFQYGPDTEINVSASISDYSNINDGELRVNLRDMTLSQEDLQSFIRIGVPDYASPDQLVAMGDLNLRMIANGRLRQFLYEGEVITGQGGVSLNGTGHIGNQFKSFVFKGPVTANNIKVGNIIGEDVGIGNTTINTNIKLSIIQDSTISVAADGRIESTSFKEYHYSNIFFNGVYSGNNIVADIRSDTERNKFDLSGDITFGEIMKFDVKGDVERLELTPFVAIESWKDPYLRVNIDGNLSGRSLDDLTGMVVIDNISLADSNFFYNPGAIYLQALPDEGEGKKIEFMSSFFEGNITGDYYFSTIGEELMRAIHPHLPSVIVEKEEQEQVQTGKNNFQFNIQLQNTEDISYALSLPFYNVEPATISGRVDMTADESLRIDAHLPRIMVGNNDIRETKMGLRNHTSDLKLDVNSYLVQNNGYINVKLDSDVASDSVNNRLSFDMKQNNTNSNGELMITMGFRRDIDDRLAANIRIPPARISFNNKQIDFNDAAIAYSKDRIVISNFGIREDNMLLLGIDGVASKSEADNIRIYFNNTDLANILNAFNVTNFSGSINGDIYVRQALDNPMIRSEELRIENITVHGDTIGTFRIDADWDNLLSGLNLNAWLEDGGERSLDVKGYIPTGDNSPFPMDINLSIADFKLMAIQPLTTGIFSELNGRLNSNIHVTGTLSEPITEGWLGIDDGVMKVAFTNVTYYVSDTIEISRDNVGLKDLVIRDQNNHTATLNVSLSHTNFGRMVYNAGIRLNDFMLLNNANRTDLMAYGNLKLSGELKVTGSPSGIFGNGNLTSSSKSDVTIVLPQTATATEYSGIVYVSSKSREPDSLAFLRKNEESGGQLSTNVSQGIPIVMAVTVNLTPLLEAGVVLDPTTGNALEVSGEGELSINFNSRSTPPVLLYGDYVLNSGKFHYNLQNLRTIEFNIREGSRLSMEGNPMNTQFNVTAYRSVRADLAALSNTFKTELANTRVPVNALLQIRGNLQGMDLQFDVELPENSNDVQQRVKSFMTNEETKILQVVYLVTTGGFMPSEGSPDTNFGSSTVTNVAANALSRGLDALFARALRDNWSVSTNLESVDGSLENVRMGVDVSTRLMDNRLRISTNLSYGDNSMLVEGQQQFLGEFELEYDINTWLMLRAFNRANQRFYRRSLTTQGVGIMVTREAKEFKDLFDLRFVRPKKEEED